MKLDSRTILMYLACYAFWLIFAAMGLQLLFLLRINLTDIAIYFGFTEAAYRALHNFAMLFLGIAWLIFVIVSEHYLRTGIASNELWRRAGGTLLVLLIMIGLSFGFHWMFVSRMIDPS